MSFYFVGRTAIAKEDSWANLWRDDFDSLFSAKFLAKFKQMEFRNEQDLETRMNSAILDGVESVAGNMFAMRQKDANQWANDHPGQRLDIGTLPQFQKQMKDRTKITYTDIVPDRTFPPDIT